MSNANKITVHIDPELEELIPGFLESRYRDIESINESLEKDEYETIEILGHSLKGNGAGYGFDELSNIGRSMESAAKEKNRTEIEICAEKLFNYLERVEVVYD
ncbi:MAG: Hpt domain-containing protein [Proteobacteria bacterium]|nr:Hpt domain-containing protein [Pseudomonadota bacterium]